MTSSRHARERELFLEARRRPEKDRASFLDRECRGDEELRRAVTELLVQDEELGLDGGALNDPIGSPGGAKDGGTEESTTEQGAPRTSPSSDAREGSLGSATDPYQALPSDVVRSGVRRLRLVAVLVPLTLAAMWLLPVAIAGRLTRELSEVHQWGPPVVAIAASVVVVWLTLSRRPPGRVLDLGLVYQVVVSYALVAGQYWETFLTFSPDAIDFHVVGFSVVAPWMLLFSVLVPVRPRRALPALFGSASAPAIVYLVNVEMARAPALEASGVFYAFVFPHIATVAFAYLAMHVVYGLGRAVGEAREVGSYRLEELLGEGGTGRVWRASHRLLARPAAVKLIRPEALARDPESVEQVLARFEAEARTTSLLRSPNTVALYDFGRTADGTLYHVMELLDGVGLDRLVRRDGTQRPSRVVHLMAQACASLAEAHERGLVHGDVKPANLFVCRLGIQHDVLKVLDFGLTRPLPRTDAGRDGTGRHQGTPAFMAPEIASGEGGDARSDVYGLGAAMFWVLTGRTVSEAHTTAGALTARVIREPPAPSETGAQVPPSLDEVVLRCLAREPAERYQSALELREALQGLEDVAAWTETEAATWWAESASPRLRLEPLREGDP